MTRLKVWLANKVISVFYRVLYWAWEVKVRSDVEKGLYVYQIPEEFRIHDRARMN